MTPALMLIGPNQDPALVELVERELTKRLPRRHTFTHRHEIRRRLMERAGTSALPDGEVVAIRLDSEWDK